MRPGGPQLCADRSEAENRKSIRLKRKENQGFPRCHFYYSHSYSHIWRFGAIAIICNCAPYILYREIASQLFVRPIYCNSSASLICSIDLFARFIRSNSFLLKALKSFFGSRYLNAITTANKSFFPYAYCVPFIGKNYPFFIPEKRNLVING